MHVCHIHNKTSTQYACEENLFQPNHPFTSGLKHRVFIPRIYYGKLQGYLHPLVFGVEGLVVSFPDLPESGVNRPGVHCGIFCSSAKPDTHRSVLLFSAWCSQLPKTNQRQLSCTTHKHIRMPTKSQLEVCWNTWHSVHFHPRPFTRPFTRPSFLILRMPMKSHIFFDFSKVWFRD